MSRIGKIPVAVPEGVTVNLAGRLLSVEGTKGRLEQPIPAGIELEIEGSEIKVLKKDDNRKTRGFHGLTRTLIANMVHGVSEGFQKNLEISGVGYRAETEGSLLTLLLGYSRPVTYEVPEGISVAVDKQTLITVKGADKQLVGQVAADIRAFRVVEPYKGKGIRYSGEMVRRKAGKAGKGGAK
ncbi:MAG: 50S ribosomal protein L6 [Thermodesulfobacteriota bacterium]